jgi:Fe-S-cluster containining protein
MEPLPMILQKAGLTSQRCLACDVCCRFASPTASFIPFFSSAEMEASGQTAETASHFLSPGRSSGERVLVVPHGEGYRCPFFQPATQECAIYERRPLECRIYPLVVEPRAQTLRLDPRATCVRDGSIVGAGPGPLGDLSTLLHRLSRLDAAWVNAYLRLGP